MDDGLAVFTADAWPLMPGRGCPGHRCPRFRYTGRRPLPSWNDGTSKRAIVAFVEKVTTQGSPEFVPVAERIAVFDNDGTLWAEKPVPFEMYFTSDRIRALAPQHPEWKTTEPYRSVIAKDSKGVAAAGKQGVMEMLAATHAGMSIDEFNRIVGDWITTARHPQTGKPYPQMIYQPMLELLEYVRAKGFKTYIVSGGGQEFMRAWTERVYGIPPEQVIGSNGELEYRAGRRQAGTGEAGQGRPDRRRCGQARRHPAFHRAPPDLRFRQFRWRPADAGVDNGRQRAAFRRAGPSHRRQARIRLRPQGHAGQARQSLGPGQRSRAGRWST